MFRLPVIALTFGLGCCLCLNHTATAQTSVTSSILDVSESRTALQRDPQRLRSLLLGVQGGGVVVVSSDAAQLFGFGTVAVRERTRERAGQRWGHGVAALGFGASPLLWSAQGQSVDAKDDGMPGVRSVFYTLPEAEDVLVSDLGKAGIPLLRVDDVGAPAQGEKPLYAAALRRFGKGWVVFAPRHIGERVDGAQFKKNLQAFEQAAAQNKWQVMPASLLTVRDQNPNWKRLRQGLSTGTVPAQDEDDQAPQDQKVQGQDAKAQDAPPQEQQEQVVQEQEGASKPKEEAFVPVSKEEARAIDAVWQEAQERPEEPDAQPRARAVLALLRVRLGWLHPEEGAPNEQGQALEAPLPPLSPLAHPAEAPAPQVQGDNAPQGENPAQDDNAPQGNNPVQDDNAPPGNDAPRGGNPARAALGAIEEGGPYASLARFWNGVLALRSCDLSVPDEQDTPQVRLRAFSFAGQAREAASWWQGASCPVADGSTSTQETAKARASTALMIQAHRDDPPLLATWTTGDATLCSTLMWPMHAASDEFPPNPYKWGMPLADAIDFPFANHVVLVPWNDPHALRIGAVARPLEYPPSNQFYPQMIWRCSSWWAHDLPHSLGFSALPLRFKLQPEQVVGIANAKTYNIPGLPGVVVRSGGGGEGRHVLCFDFIHQAYLQGNTLITVEAPFHAPVPTPEVLRLRLQHKHAQSAGGDGSESDGFTWFEDSTWLGIQEANSETLPARVARMASWQEVVRWCDSLDTNNAATTPRAGAAAQRDNGPEWLSQGLQNLFSLQTATFLDNNQNTPDNVFPVDLHGNSRLNQPNGFLVANVREMGDEAHNQSEAARPLDELSSLHDTEYGSNCPPLEEEASTQQVELLYTRFGAGAVVELVQRLGEGESTDEALQHTIGLNQNDFFDLWRQNTPPTKAQ